MSSAANPNPWPPYDSYKDCSQGICNLYCPQWCYIIFPPPPPSFYLGGDDDGDGGGSSSSDFSPLLIALIGILASAFILVSYYTVISKFCHRRRNAPGGASGHDRDISSSAADTWQGNGTPATADGLDEALIKSIAVYKYKKGDGFVECTDCSVCLSEFEENERLRLLPKCNHAFHVHCIDTWLKSHSNCPLCRAYITTATTAPVTATDAAVAVSNNPISVHPIARESGNRGGGSTQINLSAVIHQRQTDDSVVFIEDLEIGARDEAVVNVNVGSQPKPPELEASDVVRARGEGGEETQAIRTSVSMNSGAALVSIADILREIEYDENNDEDSVGAGTSQRREEEAIGKTPAAAAAAANQRNGVSNFLVRSSMAMKRSVSTGMYILPRYDWGRNYRLPN